MRYSKPTPVTRVHQWHWLRSHTVCGNAFCGSTPKTRSGRTATALSSRMVTPQCCCIACSILPVSRRSTRNTSTLVSPLCLVRGLLHDRCVVARKCSTQAVTCWELEPCVCVSYVVRLSAHQPYLNVCCWSCINKEEHVPKVGVDHLLPEEVADC